MLSRGIPCHLHCHLYSLRLHTSRQKARLYTEITSDAWHFPRYPTRKHCITILYYTILYYTILYYTILYYTILYYTILYYTILYCTVLYCTVLYYTILYYTILYYTILYYTILSILTKNYIFENKNFLNLEKFHSCVNACTSFLGLGDRTCTFKRFTVNL